MIPYYVYGCLTLNYFPVSSLRPPDLAVARGSETEPQFIHLTYKPTTGEVKRKVALVGKGLLFDTGGVSILFGL